MTTTDKNRKRITYPFVRRESKPEVITTTTNVTNNTTITNIASINYAIKDIKVAHTDYDIIAITITTTDAI